MGKKSYLAANFMPQSSEQYLELGLAACTQLGPRHWRRPELSLRSPLSLYLLLSLCFCFCLCRRDSFWVVFEKQNSAVNYCICFYCPFDKLLTFPKATRLTFLSNFFSRLLTCFTFTAFFRITGLKSGSSSSSLFHAWVQKHIIKHMLKDAWVSLKQPRCQVMACNSRVLQPCCCSVLLPCTAGRAPTRCHSRQSIACVCGRNRPSSREQTSPLLSHAAFSAQNNFRLQNQTQGA